MPFPYPKQGAGGRSPLRGYSESPLLPKSVGKWARWDNGARRHKPHPCHPSPVSLGPVKSPWRPFTTPRRLHAAIQAPGTGFPPTSFLRSPARSPRSGPGAKTSLPSASATPIFPHPSTSWTKSPARSYNPPNHRYPETDGLPELRKAIAGWYGQRFGQDLDPNKEVVPLIGAKEGIGHAAFCFVDPGDVALIPDPAYPVYNAGTLFAGGEPYFTPLKGRERLAP